MKLQLKKMVDIQKNAAYWGQTLLIFILWLSAWSLIELTTERYIQEWKNKMILYAVLFILSSIVILLSASEFFAGI